MGSNNISRSSRRFLGAIAGVLVIALAAVFVAMLVMDDSFEDVTAGTEVLYTIEQGQSFRAVSDDLQVLSIVRSSGRLRSLVDDALARGLRPGTYTFRTGSDYVTVLDVLAQGPDTPLLADTRRFTVQEGLTVAQTLERLAQHFEAFELAAFQTVLDERVAAGANVEGVLRLPEWFPEPADAPDNVFAFEGVFMPQTYDVELDATPLFILQRMVDQLEREFAVHSVQDADRYRLLTIASLIERETRIDTERPVVAGVIANRLALPMRLQIDATVVFALGGGPRQRVLFTDLEIDSPYNTYRYDGLPPGPIAGVSAASLAAAVNPQTVTYFYYVLDPVCDGTHRFADTLNQHNQHVAAFRQAGRCE